MSPTQEPLRDILLGDSRITLLGTAHVSRASAEKVQELLADDTYESVLAVVGAGHVSGIYRYLNDSVTDPQETVQQLDQVPRPRRWPKLIPWLIVALIFVGFAVGFSRSPALYGTQHEGEKVNVVPHNAHFQRISVVKKRCTLFPAMRQNCRLRQEWCRWLGPFCRQPGQQQFGQFCDSASCLYRSIVCFTCASIPTSSKR